MHPQSIVKSASLQVCVAPRLSVPDLQTRSVALGLGEAATLAHRQHGLDRRRSHHGRIVHEKSVSILYPRQFCVSSLDSQVLMVAIKLTSLTSVTHCTLLSAYSPRQTTMQAVSNSNTIPEIEQLHTYRHVCNLTPSKLVRIATCGREEINDAAPKVAFGLDPPACGGFRPTNASLATQTVINPHTPPPFFCT